VQGEHCAECKAAAARPPASGEQPAPGAAAAAGQFLCIVCEAALATQDGEYCDKCKPAQTPGTAAASEQKTTDDGSATAAAEQQDSCASALPPGGSNPGAVETPGSPVPSDLESILRSEPDVAQSEGSAQTAAQQDAPAADAPSEFDPKGAPAVAQTTDDSAAAKPTDDMIAEFFKTFRDSVRLIKPAYLPTLCDIWKIEFTEFMGVGLEVEDVEGCVEKIINVMVDRSARCWPPKYPVCIAFCIGAKTLPRDVEEFREQEEKCKACLVVRQKWDRPGRAVTNYFCNSHMFGACVVGLPFEYRQF
jgi:hypothetical protein